MSLFQDLNKANKIMLGLNEGKEEPKVEEVKEEEVKEEEVKVEEEVKEEEKVEETKEEKLEEGKKGKKCESEEEEEEEEEEIDEELKVYFANGFELHEGASLDLFICEDCGALCEHEGECDDCGGYLEEAMKMVVKNGKVVKKKIKTRKQKMSAKQKAALKKAQKKSQSAGAKKARAKSMKVRSKKGLNEGENKECPECGYVGTMRQMDDGVWECPDCHAELEIAEESVDESVDYTLEMYKRALDIPEFVINEGNDFIKSYIKNVFDIDLDEE